MTGKLYVVGTPIGNLGDLSPRATEVLAKCDGVACEDSRRLRKLMSHLQLPMPDVVVGIDKNRERSGSEQVLDHLRAGKQIALVSDAGMPTISDPGAILVELAADNDVAIEVIPGPTAVSAALSLSGFQTQPFLFMGFIDKKGGGRSKQIDQIASFTGAVVCYESPKRLSKLFSDLAELDGDRQAVVARELTKVHETVYRGTVFQLADELDQELKGEAVVVFGPVSAEVEISDAEITNALTELIETGSSGRDAVEIVADRLKVAKNRVYELHTKPQE